MRQVFKSYKSFLTQMEKARRKFPCMQILHESWLMELGILHPPSNLVVSMRRPFGQRITCDSLRLCILILYAGSEVLAKAIVNYYGD